jgi:PAS domain S-box-containing protein
MADESVLRDAIREIADQLCLAVDGRVDFVVRSQITDIEVQKLVVLINFLLDSANRLLEAQEAQSRSLDALVMERSALLKATWDTLLDGLIVIDAGGKILATNPAAEKLLKAPQTMIGHNIREFMPDPQRSEHDGYLLRYQQTGERRIIGIGREVEAQCFDGERIPVRLAVSEISINGQHRYVGLLRDIREERAQLERVQQERARAQEASLAKSRFLAAMSHELRTPLNAVIGYSELILEELSDGFSVQNSRKDLEAIRDAGRHLLSLINDVLDLSRIEAGHVELRVDAFDPVALTRSIHSTLRPLVEKKGNRFLLELPETAAQIQSDAGKLRQCLINLLGNAAKFTEAGVVTLRLGWDVGQSLLSWEVLDTGIGMTEAQLGRIFEAFTQADDSIERRYGGTGLGLTLTLQLAQMLGARLEVESQPGQGSCFRLLLPIVPVTET